VSAPRAPRAVGLLASGAIGLALGLLLVRASIHEQPAGMRATMADVAGSDDSEVGAGERGGDDSPSAQDDTSDPFEADVESEAPESPESESESEVGTLSGTVAPAETVAPAGRSVRRGRVAYIRCEGIADGDGRCPRDRDLEAAAWDLIGGLDTCASRPPRGGTADVRFYLQASGNEVRFRDWGDSPLPIDALRRCFEVPAAALSSSLRADPLVVSFRFTWH